MAIFFYGCMTLDGYLADKNNEIGWLHDLGTVEETTYSEFYNQMDILIMGRKTFDEIKEMAHLENFYGATKNYVFTHQKNIETELFETVTGDVVEFISSLPPEKNVWIVGGNSLMAPILDNHLIDKMYLQVAPVLLGEGVSLFTQKEGKQVFRLLETHQYGQFTEMVLEKIEE